MRRVIVTRFGATVTSYHNSGLVVGEFCWWPLLRGRASATPSDRKGPRGDIYGVVQSYKQRERAEVADPQAACCLEGIMRRGRWL